jgi:exonuclease III
LQGLLKEDKEKAKERKVVLLGDIKRLKNRYDMTKQKVQTTVKVVELNSSCSNLRSDIAIILGHIDSSITELRTNLAIP